MVPCAWFPWKIEVSKILDWGKALVGDFKKDSLRIGKFRAPEQGRGNFFLGQLILMHTTIP